MVNNAVAKLDSTAYCNWNTGNGTVETGKKVGAKITQSDGKITGISVITNDIASAESLSTLTRTVSGHTTSISNINITIGASDEAGLRKRIKDLETEVENLKKIISYSYSG